MTKEDLDKMEKSAVDRINLSLGTSSLADPFALEVLKTVIEIRKGQLDNQHFMHTPKT